MDAGYIFENIIFGDSSSQYWIVLNKGNVFKTTEWDKEESFFNN